MKDTYGAPGLYAGGLSELEALLAPEPPDDDPPPDPLLAPPPPPRPARSESARFVQADCSKLTHHHRLLCAFRASLRARRGSIHEVPICQGYTWLLDEVERQEGRFCSGVSKSLRSE